MKRTIIVAIACLALAFSLSGCYTAKIVAPASGDVKLANSTEPLPIKVQKKNWYILFGLVPLNSTKTDKLIAENNLKKVRVVTKTKFEDILISFGTSFITIYPRSIIIEGDTKE